MSCFQEAIASPQNKEKNRHIYELLFFAAAAFLILLPASRSSFLYPCNDWNDANSYFSVGKALFNGKLPYRDVFDQKGMYLYFFYGLAYLISHTTFAGVFVLELILAAFDLLAICRILELYVKRKTALLLSPMVLAASFSSFSFYWGGSAEEVCLPFLLWGIYLSIRYFKTEYPQKAMDAKTLLSAGILAGMVANIKFTSLGLYFAWMMCVAFAFLARKDFFGAVKACLIFLGGMALPFIPWAIYFACHKALYWWWWGYVYVNVFVYSNLNGEGPHLFERVYTLAKLLYWVMRQNLNYFVFLIPGVLFTLLQKGQRLLPRLHVVCMCFFLFLGIYVGGSVLPYYALPLSVFTVFGFALLGKMAEAIWEKVGKREAYETVLTKGDALAGFACVLISMLFVFLTSMNIPWMQEKKEDIFLYRFKEIVEETENPTLLNIGCLDAGLYTVCDIVPTCQWFQTQTIMMEHVLSEQERYIREGQTDYIIARDSFPEVIWEQYELVAEAPWNLKEQEFTYYLFRKKGV